MQNNSQQSIVSAIIIAGVIIAGAILLKGNGTPTVATPPNNNIKEVTAQVKPVSKDDHIMGDLNAKVIIVEYSDIECPYCKVFHATMQKVVQNSNGNVAWVFRNNPIPQLHSKAFKESEATECAWEQGGNDAFWKYVNGVFAITPSNNGLDPAELPKIAGNIGLNVTSFNNCLSSGKYTSKVQAEIDDGIKAGVTGTPSSFILVGGKVIDTIPGAQPYESVMQRLGQIK